MLLFEAAKVCDLVTLLVDDGVSIADESRKRFLVRFGWPGEMESREHASERSRAENVIVDIFLALRESGF